MNKKGQALVEYVLIISLITVVAIAAVRIFGGYLKDSITKVSCAMVGKEYVEENNNYSNGDEYNIPSGTYTCETGESFTFLVSKPNHHELFQYKNKDIVIEGIINRFNDEHSKKKCFTMYHCYT